MKKAQTGDMTVRFENHYKGEIGQLGDSFNAMVEKINELLGVVYKEQKNKREAELKILHEQIKPHFLYNTLDTIQWMQSSTMRRILLIWCLLCQDFPYQSESGKRIYYIGTGSFNGKELSGHPESTV